MKLDWVSLENFRAHRRTEIRFPLTGIIGLVGDNESGKSTILESLVFALYGAAAIRGKMGSLRWRGAAKRQIAKVTWHIGIGGTTYEVMRSETKAHVISDTTEGTLASGQKGVTEFCTKLIGMDHAEFAASYLCEQKDIGRLATMRPLARQTFVRRVLGQEVLDDAVKETRKTKNEIGTTLKGFRASMLDGDEIREARDKAALSLAHQQGVEGGAALAVEEIGKELEALRERVQDGQKLATDYQERRRRIHENARRLQRLDQEIERCGHEVATAKAAKAEVEEIEAKLGKLDYVVEIVREHERLQRDAAELEQGTRFVEERQREATTVRRTVRELRATADAFDTERYERLQSQIAEVEREERDLREERIRDLAAARAEQSQLQSQLKELETAFHGNGICPTCKRPVDNRASLEEQIGQVATELGEASTAVVRLQGFSPEERRLHEDVSELRTGLSRMVKDKAECDKASADAAGMARHLQSLQKTIEAERDRLRAIRSRQDVEYDADAHRKDKALLQRLRTLEGRVGPLRQQAARLGSAERRLEDVERERTDLYQVQTEAEAELLDHRWHERSHVHRDDVTMLELREGEHRRAEELRQAAKVEVARWEGRKEAAERQLATWEGQRGQEKRLADALALEETFEERLVALRVAVLGSIQPELEELVSGFVHILSDGRHESAAIDDTFGVTLYEDGQPSPVVSGGAEDIRALALRLGISQLLAERSGNPLGTIILDEPMGSLDATRRANVLSLLRRLEGIFPQIVLISHVAETKDCADFVVELSYCEERQHTIARTPEVPHANMQSRVS